MATDIDQLLRGAQLLWSSAAPRSSGTPEEFLVGWSRLARSAERALALVPGVERRPPVAVVAALRRLQRGSASAMTSVPGEPAIAGVAQRLGAVADLLVDARQPRGPEEARAAGVLLDRLLATLHRAAQFTLPMVQSKRSGWSALNDLAEATRPWAAIEHDAMGYLEELVAVTSGRQDVIGAARLWERAAVRTLAEPTTALAYQTIAADLAVLAGTSAVLSKVDDTLARDGGDPAPWSRALTEAARGWSLLSQWPDTLDYRGARTPELDAASKDLREAVTAEFRRDRRWLTSEQLLASMPAREVLREVRLLLDVAARVAGEYRDSFARLVTGGERLWVRADAVPEEWRTGEVRLAVRRGRWVILDEAGRQAATPLLRQARRAAAATLSARDAIQQSDRQVAGTRGAAHATLTVPADALVHGQGPRPPGPRP